jgi:hypothetical protein
VCVGGLLVNEGTIAGNVEVGRRFEHVQNVIVLYERDPPTRTPSMSDRAGIRSDNPNPYRRAAMCSNDALSTGHPMKGQGWVAHGTHQNLNHLYLLNGLLHLGMYRHTTYSLKSSL